MLGRGYRGRESLGADEVSEVGGLGGGWERK